MNNKFQFFNNYLNQQSDLLNHINNNDLSNASKMISKIKKNKLLLVGNGGSASICSHMARDFAKVHNIRSLSFSSDSFLTCFANDYGYENWSKNALNIFCDKNDIVILISSSGMSKNILLAADFCKKKKINFITMSGFNKNNKLNKYGNINFWVNSKVYNHIEMTHHIILTAICDSLLK